MTSVTILQNSPGVKGGKTTTKTTRTAIARTIIMKSRRTKKKRYTFPLS